MMFLRKQSQEKQPAEDENKTAKKLTKAQKLKQKKLLQKEKILEQKRSLLKAHLAREIEYGRTTYRKHEKSWRKMITEVSLPQKKEGLEYIWQSFERLIDAKDFVISCLLDEIRQADDQYLMDIRMHVTTVERIILLLNEQLQQFHCDFMSDLQSLRDQHNVFLDNIHQVCGQSIYHLKTILFGMELEDKERERSLRADLCSKVELVNYDKHGAILEMTERLTFMLEYMLRNTNDVIEAFLKKTKQRREDYDSFKIADDKAQEILSSGMKKLQHLNVVIRKLKKKEEDLHHNELRNLEGDKKFFQRAFLILKLKLADDLKLDKAKQEFFIYQFYEAFDSINGFLKRGENILTLLRSTRNLETLDEKAKPYPIFRQVSDSMTDDKMFLFWQRIGKANISRTALVEERKFLRRENDSIRKKIEDMCSCLSCPKLPPICTREGPIPFTDGFTLMKKYEMMSRARRS
ncbi:dynein regulatory complex subunit 2-like [Coccinella septempunctata]|uniref:dynein regulatory complex subunit 2-like n=1 Tax=Coccinella septempunctata TaxID=41139 RepID=UPI001D05FE9B|nr:dynein regulatory complex subunit 2-like [Coccinella septempunctata]